MKLIAALMATALVAGAAPAQTRPVIVMVHGRGHSTADTAALRREWRSALDASLGRLGHRRIPDADVRLAWYADVLDPLAAGCERAASEETDGLEAFGLILSALVGTIPRGEGREARSLVGDMLYVMDESRRCAAQKRVGRVIEAALDEGRPVILIAYSLGALVAYEHLHTRAPRAGDPPIDLVTIGSPLAIPELRELLGVATDSLRRPRSVRSWQNIHDPADGFSAPVSSGADSLTAIDRKVRGDGGADPHLIGRYLRDAATAESVARLLNPGTRNDR